MANANHCADLREKGNQEALLPIGEGLNAVRTLAYQKADKTAFTTPLLNYCFFILR